MFVPPNLELLAQVQAVYTDEFLAEVFRLLEVDDPAEQKQFKKAVTLAGAGYLQYLENNAGRKRPHKQTKALQKYKEALQAARAAYEEVLSDTPTRTKFHNTLREEYLKQTEQMQEMLRPYQDGGGYNQTLFCLFLDMLIEVCEKAKTKHIGRDKAIAPNQLLAWWIANIGICWPKSSPVKFQLGDYKSTIARDVLYQLMRKIDAVSEANIRNAMQKAVIKEEIQEPLKLLLG